MRILSVALFLLWGACATNPGSASPENFGGDINSPNGQAWMGVLRKGGIKGVQNPYGSWEPTAAGMPLDTATGDIESFQVPDKTSVFVGAPSASTAFYRSPQDKTSGLTIESRVEGFFISNLRDDAGNSNKILIYPAALRLTEAQTNAIKVQVGIPMDRAVEQASAELQIKYNNIVHVPSNYDLTKPVVTNGESRPQAIIKLP